MNMNGLAGRRTALSLVVVATCVGALIAPCAASAAASPTAGVVGSHLGFAGDDGSRAAPLPMIRKVRPDGVVTEDADPKALQARVVAAATSGCGRQCDAQNPATYVYRGPGGPSNWYPCSYDAVTARSVNGIELRYSPRCRTAWTRSSVNNDMVTWSYYLNGTERTYTAEVGNHSVEPNGQTHFTAMVDDADLLAEACGGDMSYVNAWWCTSTY